LTVRELLASPHYSFCEGKQKVARDFSWSQISGKLVPYSPPLQSWYFFLLAGNGFQIQQ
jgi:hypothetical protein